MTVQEIIANKGSIFTCAKAFRADANALMCQLAQQFNFDINKCGEWPVPVYQTSRNNKGALRDDWVFYLHGSHCRFENVNTGQILPKFERFFRILTQNGFDMYQRRIVSKFIKNS